MEQNLGFELSGHDPSLDDHSEAVDERWLLSYADMMTLLFGFFVMLYVMNDRLDEVKASAAQQFTSHHDTKSDTESKDQLRQQIETLSKEKETLRDELSS